MRILLVTSMVPDANGIGAMPKLFDAQLRGLRERHEVTLVSTFGEDRGQADAAARLLESDLDAHIVDRRRSRSAARRWRVRAELTATWTTKRWPWRVVSGAAGVQALIDDLAGSRAFDVVAVEDNPLAVLRFPAGMPTVLTEHEAVRAAASEWHGGRLSERPLRALRAFDWRRWDAFLPAAWRRFDLVQVYSQADAMSVRRLAPDLSGRIRVNPYGVVLPARADPAREQSGTILFAGTFTHLPNRDAALWLAEEIMPAVLARHPGARLRLVGSAPPREVLQLAGPNIEVIGDVPSMDPHLDAAAVVVAPLRTGGGMRMKVLEAMSRQKAVVTTGLGAAGFTDFGFEPPLAIAEGSRDFAEATASLLNDERRRFSLARRAREFVETHHSPEAWASRLERVYTEAGERAEEQI